MNVEMVMPKLGESITEGTILKWLKKEGDLIEKDELILEISTDKVDSEIPTPVPGKIAKILVHEGDVVQVGKPIAIIQTKGAAQTAVTEPSLKEKTLVEPMAEKEAKETPKKLIKESAFHSPEAKNQGRRFYSPVVMNIARNKNVGLDELEQIEGSGLNGRVTKKDILDYINRKKVAANTVVVPQQFQFEKGEVEIIPMDNMRRRIAEHMIQSKHTSAHVSLYTEVDMNHVGAIIVRNKKTFKKREGFSLTYTPFIVEATVNALKEFPFLNASLDGDRILVKKYYNIGIAVALDKGLIVPNIFQADTKNLLGIARAVYDIARRARTKQLNPDEIQNGTFSISNFGVFGTTLGFPIINQPQVAILGVGAVKKRPVIINDAIAIRPVMYLSLTIDHRLIDGAMGSQYLERVREYLENYDPEMTI